MMNGTQLKRNCIRFLTRRDAIDHLNVVHHQTNSIQYLEFSTFSDFLHWKQEEETTIHSNYVQMCAPRTSAVCRHHYYYCNRSGKYVQKGKGQRIIKVQGSCKSGKNCLAHIKVSDNGTGLVKVEYYNSHNHEVLLGHLRIAHNTRGKIASQLEQGIPAEKIMDMIRDSIPDGITREHIITKQDIRNVQNQYNIQGISRHANDLTSVMAWVEECKRSPHNPVLFFKPQGKQQEEDMDDMGDNDFLLVLQTQFQLDMLKANGHKCICMVPPMV